jgi:hypothetical protein
LIDAGACAALVEALKVAVVDNLNVQMSIGHLLDITYAIREIARIWEGLVALIAAGACAALLNALSTA